MAKKTDDILPAHVSITFRVKIDGEIAKHYPPDDPQCLASNLHALFRHALLSRLEYGRDLLMKERDLKTDQEKTIHAASVEANEVDIELLKRLMDDHDNPVFTRVRTRDGKVWPSREAIKAHLKANRAYRKYKEDQKKAEKR